MSFDHRSEHVDDNMILIQANLDDMNPEHCPYVTDQLFKHGANDAYWIPIIMKKGRPGLMLNVLVDRDKLSAMEEVIFTETSTLGLRYFQASCHRLGRTWQKVTTSWGEVSVKVGYYQGKPVQYAPEHEDCAEIARSNGVPLKMVYEEVRLRFEQEREAWS